MRDNIKKNKRKKMTNKQKKILTVLILVNVLIIVLALSIFIKDFFSYKYDSFTNDLDQLGINKSLDDKFANSQIVNIALYGLGDYGLSDSIMIVSVDKKGGYIKLTSIARDSQVKVEKRGLDKITHAHSTGGAKRAVKALNENFDMNIKDYVSVHMDDLMGLIDVVDGVTIEITDAEKTAANQIMAGRAPKASKIASSGKVKLTGAQATAYCRIRSIGTDYARMTRQRTVLNALFNKSKNLGIPKLTSLAKESMKFVKTSLKFNEIIDLASIMTKKNVQLVDLQIPMDSYHAKDDPSTPKMSELVYDLDVAAKDIHSFIYEDKRFE